MNHWYEEAIFYHIYPLGLCDVPKENNYRDNLENFPILNQWIEHVKAIGCNAIYIGPLFESATHGYDTTDYKRVDRRLGSNQDFRNLVDKCHQEGIKVVVDGVFNHTGRDFAAFKNLQELKWDSWGKDWYSQVDFNQRSPMGDPFSYECWGGHAILPRLNMNNPKVREYLMEVVKYWVEEFNIDGIRLDCADVLDFNFMSELRHLANHVKEDFWLMGEVIHGDYSRWANPEILHSVTNYELHKSIYSAHNAHNYFEMAHTIKRLFGEPYGLCRDARLYNFVDNHDVDRIASKLDNIKNLLPVHVFLYTIMGIPSLYYGSEWGIKGRKQDGGDDILRPALNLAELDAEDNELVRLITKLAGIRLEHKELSHGSYQELILRNKQYVYAKIYNHQGCIIVLNNDTNAEELSIDVPLSGRRVTDLISGKSAAICEGRIHWLIEANSGAILKVE